MALRTRYIRFILHSSEVRFITRPVIPMDMDGLHWIPMDPIGFHSTNGCSALPTELTSQLGAGQYVGSKFHFFTAVQIYEFHTSKIIIYHLNPSWLVSSVGKALHRYRRGHGFKSRTGLNFLQLLFSTTRFSSVLSCEVLLISFLHRSVIIWISYV